MKIEMGESLCYSWLRHTKRCQLVQTNWKVSPYWEPGNTEELQALMDAYAEFYRAKHNYDLFKKSSLEQLLMQAEVDVIGIAISESAQSVYAIDVAYHEAGLNYGSKEETISRVIKKYARTALCLYGYFNIKEGEIIFASPKTNPAIGDTLAPLMEELSEVTARLGLGFRMLLITNVDFESEILNPVVSAGNKVADTGELFLRSVQMYKMFDHKAASGTAPKGATLRRASTRRDVPVIENDRFPGMKVGKIAQTALRQVITSGKLPDDIIAAMQTAEYSKIEFDLQYPLLVEDGQRFDSVRYYTTPLFLNGKRYYMCSQWFETTANNDRGYLLNWLEKWM